MMATQRRDRDVLREYSKEVEEGNAAIFAGAGLSIPAGFVELAQAAQDGGRGHRPRHREEYNLVAVAEYYCNSATAPTSAGSCSRSSPRTPTWPARKTLARLPIVTYWTTN